MKIKYLAIALLSTTLISNPLFAKDKVKPIKVVKVMDAASPAAAVDQTTVDELKVVESQKVISTRDVASGMAKGKRTHAATSTATSENTASDVFIKIEGIEGESTKASSTIPPQKLDMDGDEDGELVSVSVEEVDDDKTKVSEGTVPHHQYGKYGGAKVND